MEVAAPSLTPQLVRQIVEYEEFGLREQENSSPAVTDIFRYGGMIGCRIEHHPKLTRGMDRARQLIRETEENGRSMASGLVIVADQLTGGKGRFTRVWHAPEGGVWLTLVLVNTLLPETSRLYPLAVGIACCETLRHYTIPAQVKWVNDVHVKGRKIAGTLIETELGPRYGEEYLLIGVGINVNNQTFPPDLADLAVSAKELLNRELDVTRVIARLLAKLTWNIGLLHYEEHRRLMEDEDPGGGGGHPILERWQQLSDMMGRRVVFGYDVQQNPQYEARVQGLDDSGGLILKLDDNTTIIEHSGEITFLD